MAALSVRPDLKPKSQQQLNKPLFVYKDWRDGWTWLCRRCWEAAGMSFVWNCRDVTTATLAARAHLSRCENYAASLPSVMAEIRSTEEIRDLRVMCA